MAEFENLNKKLKTGGQILGFGVGRVQLPNGSRPAVAASFEFVDCSN